MIRIIMGGIGSGKGQRCLDEIEQIHKEHPISRCLMLVNEHYSHETEKVFNERFGGTGLNNIEVTTFKKLSVELLSESQRRTMNDAGQQIILQKTVSQYMASNPEINSNLRRAIRRNGFLDVLAQMIDEIKHYDISIEELKQTAHSITDNNSLKEKLCAIADMYEIYYANFSNIDYTDSGEIPELLAQAINEKDCFTDTYMWIDKFDEILPQQMKVVEALYNKVKQLTVSVCYPTDDMEKPLYAEIERTLRKIQKLDTEIEYIDCGEHLKNIKSPELKFLFDRWNSVMQYDKKAKDISVFESRSTYSEIEHAAGQIVDLVRENNYRFRDIAVICGSEEEYSYLVDTVFAEYEIPIFPDSKIILSDHPIAMQLLSVFDLFDNDFDYNSVFEYLKAGFIYEENNGKITNISQDEIDELENFVLKYGIRYKNRWFSEENWKSGNTISEITKENEKLIAIKEKEEEQINNLRKKLMAPVKNYDERSKGMLSVREHAEALFAFLEEIYLYDGLRKEIMYFIKQDEVTEADRFEQIWELILDVLDQLVITLGDEKMNREEFGSYVRTAISKCEIRIIPSGIDKVYFGTAERNAPADVRALFILGANAGTFPNEIKNEGFLSNSDRHYMEENSDVRLAPDTSGRMDKRRYNVFKTVSVATEKLFISYAMQDIDGHQLSPSRLVVDIMRKFPSLVLEDDFNESTQRPGIYIASPKVTVHKLLKSRADKTNNPVWDAVYEYYKERNLYPYLIKMIDEERVMARRFSTIPPEEAAELYGNGKAEYSASRLNVYAKCPYQYFMHYGLGLKEREVWEISAGDVGTYAHAIIEGFCHAVECGETDLVKKSEKWKELTPELKDEILNNLFKAAEDKIGTSSITQQSKVMNVMKRMEKVITNAVSTVHSSLKYGKYSIVDEEHEFSMDITDRVALRGIIDRLDMCQSDKYKGIRVIDYKTGATVFNITNILNGVDMQMVLYAAAAKEYYSQLDPENEYRLTGIYYSHVRSDVKNQKSDKTVEQMKLMSVSDKKFDGISFIESDDDYTSLYDMDERIEQSEPSDFLDLKFKSDGKIHHHSKNKVKTFKKSEKLIEAVRDIAVQYDREIREEGIIKQNPYVEGSKNMTCEFCEYSQICGIFDTIEGRVPDKSKSIDIGEE